MISVYSHEQFTKQPCLGGYLVNAARVKYTLVYLWDI